LFERMLFSIRCLLRWRPVDLSRWQFFPFFVEWVPSPCDTLGAADSVFVSAECAQTWGKFRQSFLRSSVPFLPLVRISTPDSGATVSPFLRTPRKGLVG